jgi:predicted AlkP superfamily pyrophosphatase or phosphodiesterase
LRTFNLRFFLTALSIFLLANCTNTHYVSDYEIPETFIPADHLVFIGLDGWGAAYTGKADMPNIKRMMSQGVSCVNMRSVMPSNSRPNWYALFHGVTIEQNNSLNVPSVFTLIKNNERTSAGKSVLFYEWDEFENILPDDPAEKYKIASNLESAQKIAEYINKEKPAFTAVIFNELDSIGHNHKWGSAAYYSKLTELDSLIAVIEQSVIDAGIYDSTVFILSADHGGSFSGHGANFPKQRSIPFVICGAGIKKSGVISSRTSICDIAPVMAAILGISIPVEWNRFLLQELFK